MPKFESLSAKTENWIAVESFVGLLQDVDHWSPIDLMTNYNDKTQHPYIGPWFCPTSKFIYNVHNNVLTSLYT